MAKSRKNMKDWEIFEEDIAELLGGRRQPGSGAPVMCKGDVKSEDYLVECKYTSGDHYRLNINTFEKIMEEASNQFRIPLFACRSKEGDFFIANQIDFDPGNINQDMIDLGDITSKTIVIKEPFVANFKGKRTIHSIVCWSILED